MSTGMIIALIVIVAVVAVVAAALIQRNRTAHGGPGLRRRFGPEYERTLARHDGDAKAAEHELAERVKRHGSLEIRPLDPVERERYETRWTAAQERFVDSPREALAEADRLLGELAGARGFPDGGRYDEQVDALSVHHAHHVHGYRRVHRAAHDPAADGAGSPAGTEEMREAMVEARALFEELVAPSRRDTGRHGHGTKADHGTERTRDRSAHARTGGRHHLPWGFTRRHAKGS
ncbi:hypothetical protein ACFS5L_31725 [Streptomyces phyllanthi]|uniref:Secreted protein n=1 Tax=Streptomyces phyllanthi TaxID=1803180 RepID=A0A5N8WDQ8_9ACTN|nr:hypothetical protein [Streptomyces phyllanthi]MPY45469.1 hypothetical protein [Streptomyces phyllanthi]